MRQGFSLVELSIVLVILGLLTGGILAGQNLIRAAEIRAVSTEFQRYQAATNSFRDKYFAIPGDFRDATKFWGRQSTATDCVTNSTQAVGTPGACDGNGDGDLDASATDGIAEEIFGFWQQLAHAGLIEGSYTGIDGAASINANGTALAGENTPLSKIGNATWYAGTVNVTATSSFFITNNYRNYLLFGGVRTNDLPVEAALTTEEAWNIDTKIDDGKASEGSVIAVRWSTCQTQANNTLREDYDLLQTGARCALAFKNAF